MQNLHILDQIHTNQSSSFNYFCRYCIAFSWVGMSLSCSFSDFTLEAFDSMSKAFIWVASLCFSAFQLFSAFLSAVSISFLATPSSSSFLFFAHPHSFSRAFLFFLSLYVHFLFSSPSEKFCICLKHGDRNRVILH